MALDNNTLSNYTDKNTIKNWFKTGLKPTQAQFWATWDSFWHKDEKLPISSIENLGNLIDGKAEANHSHAEYATNSATSLTPENVTQWQNKLGINDLDYVVIPTEDATVESHPYVVVVNTEGNSARRGVNDFGKVDTVNDLSPDENKNVNIDLDSTLQQGNETDKTISFLQSTETDEHQMHLDAIRGIDINKREINSFDSHRNININYKGINLLGDTAIGSGTMSLGLNEDLNQYEIKLISRYNGRRLDFGFIDKIGSSYYGFSNTNGSYKIIPKNYDPIDNYTAILPDKSGIIAFTSDIQSIFSQATNWTHSLQRFSGILDKSADATYNNLLGVDSNGYAAKVGLNAVTNAMSKATDAQKDAFRVASRKSTEGYSVGVPRVDYILPNLIANNKDEITYVSVVGLNLLLNLQDCEVKLINVTTNQEYVVSVIQTLAQSSSMFSFGFNFFNKPVGDYRIFVRNGVQTNIDTTVFTLVESISTEPLAVNFNRYFKEGLSEAYKNTFTTGVNYISKNKDTEALGNIPIADLVSESPIVIDSAKDFVFTCLFTLNTNASGYLGDAQLGLTQGFVNNIYNTVQYGVKFSFLNLTSTLTSKNLVTGLLNSSKQIQIQIIKRGSILSIVTSVDSVYSSDVATVNIVNPLYFIFKNNSSTGLNYVTANPIVINLLSLQYLN